MHVLEISHSALGEARRNPESYRTRIVTMLTTDEGDFEVQVSSKSEPEPEPLEKKKVTFAFVSEADDEVEFMQDPGTEFRCIVDMAWQAR